MEECVVELRPHTFFKLIPSDDDDDMVTVVCSKAATSISSRTFLHIYTYTSSSRSSSKSPSILNQ